MVPMSRYMKDLCSAHIRATNGSSSRRERSSHEHVDGHDRVPALAQIDQCHRELGVQQRGERDDDGAGRHGGARRQCAGTRFRTRARVEHGVEYSVELAMADIGPQPAGPSTAERDDAGAVSLPQRGLHHLRGAAQRPLGGLSRRAGGWA